MTDEKHTDVRSIHNKRISGMGRRRFLKMMEAAGLGAGAFYLTPDDVKAATDDQVPITYALAWNESTEQYSPRKKMVPADWYNDLQRAHQIHDRENFITQHGVSGSTVIPGKYGGENAKIRVEVSRKKAEYDNIRKKAEGVQTSNRTVADSKSQIPEKINDVPIEVVETKAPESACYRRKYGNSPPGGVEINHGSKYGSLGATLWDQNNNSYFSTANHIFGGDSRGEILHQHGNAIGKVEIHSCIYDFVACSPLSGYTPTRNIVGTSYRMIGHYFANGVDDLIAQNAKVEKHGVRTCKTSGTVTGRGDAWVYDSSCVNRHDQVKWGTAVDDFNHGDSGSTIYHHTKNNNALAICVGDAFVPKDDPSGNYCFGTGAYKIYDIFGLGW